MIPAGIHSFTTEGEGTFYRFLHTCAKPDDRHIAWYQPDIAGREPDFILYWISEDYRAKRSYDVTTDSVTISTIHSLKGFDYACVFVLGLDWLAPGKRWTEEQIRKPAYVAVTRAREKLFIPYCRKNEIVKMLLL